MRKAFGALLLSCLVLPLYALAQEPAGADSGSAEQAPAAEPGAGQAAEAPAEPVDDDCCCADCLPRGGTLEFYGPLSAINTHPANMLFLSPPPTTAMVLEPGQQALEGRLDYTNVILIDRDHGTWVEYDYEGARIAAEYRRGMAHGELSVQVPFYYRDRGVLDPIISSWHKLFGLPNGYRDNYADQRYRYVIRKREGLVYSDGPRDYGSGDISVGYKHALWDRRGGEDAAALRTLVKVPTGDPDFALGSGNWDVSLGALYQRQLRPHLRAYANIDYVWTGEPEWDIQSNDLLISNWMLEYSVSPRTTVVTQYRLHTNALRTGSKEADKSAREMTFGFNHRLEPNLVWSGGFTEDVYPDTAPDFVISTAFKWEF